MSSLKFSEEYHAYAVIKILSIINNKLNQLGEP